MESALGHTLLAGLALLSILSCGERPAEFYGKAIPDELPLTRISQVVTDPAEYNGKIVMLTGGIASECSSACEFWLEDSGAQLFATAEPGFTAPNLTGRKVKVYGHVITGDNVPTVILLGVELI